MRFLASGPTSPVALLFFFTSSIDYNTYFDMGFLSSGPPSPVARLFFFTSSIDYNTYLDMGFLSQDLLPLWHISSSSLLLLTTILTFDMGFLSQDLLPPWHFSSSSLLLLTTILTLTSVSLSKDFLPMWHLFFFTSSIDYNTYFDMGFFASGPPSPVALLFFFTSSSIDFKSDIWKKIIIKKSFELESMYYQQNDLSTLRRLRSACASTQSHQSLLCRPTR